MKKNILLAMGICIMFSQVLFAQSTICVTKYYTGAPTAVDNLTATMTGPTFAAADFNVAPNLLGNQCVQITDVNVETCFRKMDDAVAGGNCNTIEDGTASTFTNELGMELRSCLGNVILEGNTTTVPGIGAYTGGSTAGNMGSGRCVVWDSQAATAATTTPAGGGGVPNNGIFTPQASLGLYNGLNPIGSNFNLFIADNAGTDPFCVMGFSVTICAKVTYIEGLVAHSSISTVTVPNAEMCEDGTPTNIFDLTVNTNVVNTESVTFLRSAPNGGAFAPYSAGTVLGTVAGPAGPITGTSFDAANITLNNAVFPENTSCIAEVYNVYARFNAAPFDPGHSTCTAIANECQLFAGPILVTINPRPNIFVPNTPQVICEGGTPTPFTVTDNNSCAANNQWYWLDKPTGTDGAQTSVGTHAFGNPAGIGATFTPSQTAPGEYRYAIVKSGPAGGCRDTAYAVLTIAPRPDILELENRCDRTVQIHMDCKTPAGYSWVYAVDAAPTVGSTAFTGENTVTPALSVGNHTINTALRCSTCGAGGTPALVGTCTDAMAIDVFATPVIAPATVADICPGATATLDISTTNAQAAIAITDYHIDWGDGSETNLDDQSTIPANPTHVYTKEGTYRIHIIVKNESATGVICQTTTHVNAIVRSACNALCFTAGAFATSSNTPLCAGSTLNLTGGYTEDAAAPHTYAWTGPNNYCASTEDAARSNVRTSDAGTYSITVTNANGCTASNSTSVVINDPTVTALTPIAISVCETDAEPTIASLPNPTVTPSSAKVGPTKWFTDAALTTAYAPATATHTLASKCVADTKTLYAAVDIDCNGDGIADRTNVAAGSQTFTIYPKPLAPTTTTVGCNVVVCPACSSDVITATAATGGAATSKFAGNLYAASLGDAAGTITLSIASGIAGSTCTPTVVAGIATPACGSTCSVSWTSTAIAPAAVCSGSTATITSVMSAATGFTISFTDTETGTTFGGVADELVTNTPTLNNTGCDPQVRAITYSITCDATSSVIKTGTVNVTVNPAPTFTATANCTNSCVVNLTSNCPSTTLTYTTGATTGGASAANFSGSTYTTPTNGTAGTIMITPTNSTTGCVGTATSVNTPACPVVCTPGFGTWGN